MEKKVNKRNKKEYKRLIIGASLIVLILLILIFYLAWPLMTGKTMVLATLPLDPFDPFRGQYIAINYEISSIDIIEGAKEGDNVYAILTPDSQGIWRLDKTSLEKPIGRDFIRGKVISVTGSKINVEYGIEQFFFERNAELPNTALSVEVMVDSFGQARIVQLLYNGKPFDIKYRKPGLIS